MASASASLPVPTAADAANAPTTTAQPQQQQPSQPIESLNTCRYPSKKCWQARALKRNGEMHNLCDEHREKANKNQRRLEHKRKVSKKVAASAKRARKSRATAKSKATTASSTRPAKHVAAVVRQQPLQTQQLKKRRAPSTANLTPLPLPTPSTNALLPTGFFTDLMMATTTFAKPVETNWTPMMAQPLQQQQPQYAPNQQYALTQHHHNVYVHDNKAAMATVSVDDLLGADLDSLTTCLDSIPLPAPSPSSSLLGLGLVHGSASPIDVCDGLDAVAAVHDFWWHPVSVTDALLDSSMDDELFASLQC